MSRADGKERWEYDLIRVNRHTGEVVRSGLHLVAVACVWCGGMILAAEAECTDQSGEYRHPNECPSDEAPTQDE